MPQTQFGSELCRPFASSGSGTDVVADYFFDHTLDADRRLVYDIINTVFADCRIRYDIVNSIQADRRILYDILNDGGAQTLLLFRVGK
jgi:hypothetical protein